MLSAALARLRHLGDTRLQHVHTLLTHRLVHVQPLYSLQHNTNCNQSTDRKTVQTVISLQPLTQHKL